jgi:hypothetical protein
MPSPVYRAVRPGVHVQYLIRTPPGIYGVYGALVLGYQQPF